MPCHKARQIELDYIHQNKHAGNSNCVIQDSGRVIKTVFYAKRAPLNSDVGPLTLPIKVIKNQKSPQRVPYPKCERFGNAGQECDECSAKFSS